MLDVARRKCTPSCASVGAVLEREDRDHVGGSGLADAAKKVSRSVRASYDHSQLLQGEFGKVLFPDKSKKGCGRPFFNHFKIISSLI